MGIPYNLVFQSANFRKTIHSVRKLHEGVIDVCAAKNSLFFDTLNLLYNIKLDSLYTLNWIAGFIYMMKFGN